jgi:glycerol-3-phosphate cytidylyltransferase
MPLTLTYGSFDLLHYGHINLLAKASSLGLPLAVGLSTDEFNSKKGKISSQSYLERKFLLSQISNVKIIFPENSWEQKIEDVKKYDAQYFVMGSDWEGEFNYLNEYTKVVYFERTPIISSSEIKKIVDLK